MRVLRLFMLPSKKDIEAEHSALKRERKEYDQNTERANDAAATLPLVIEAVVRAIKEAKHRDPG